MKKEKPKKQTGEKPAVNNLYYDFAALAMIAILGILIYSNSFKCSFHFDDTPSIIENNAVHNVSDIKAIWQYQNTRFIPYYSIALNYHYGKLNVWGYHFINLLIHLVNAFLVFWLTILIFLSPALKTHALSKHRHGIALFAALLFVSHPLATESVTYIIQRLASMVALFYFLTLVFYMKARLSVQNNWIRYFYFFCAFVSGVLALLSKENAYTLPFAIVLFEIFFFQTKKITIDFKSPKVIISSLVLLVFATTAFLKFSSFILKPVAPDFTNDFREIRSHDYLLTQFSVIVKYIQLLFVPMDQNLNYDYPLSNSFFEAKVLFGFIVLVSLIIAAILLFKKHRIISFGILFFLLTIAIESSIIPLSDLIMEHRTYLPSYGFFLLVCTVIYGLPGQKIKYTGIAILSVIICVYSVASYARNKVWLNEMTLWDDVVLKSPNMARPLESRGELLREAGNYEAAISDFNRAIQLNPAFAEAYDNRGTAYYDLKKYEEAIKSYDLAIKSKTDFANAYYNRGNAYTRLGKYDEAIKDYDKTIEIDLGYTNAYYARAGAYYSLKNHEKAIDDYSRVIKLNPDNVNAYMNRGVNRAFLKQYDKALADYNTALRLKPDNAIVYYDRAIVFGELKRNEEAIRDYDNVIRLDPSYAFAYVNRGILLYDAGKKDSACADWKKALSLGYAQADIKLKLYCR